MSTSRIVRRRIYAGTAILGGFAILYAPRIVLGHSAVAGAHPVTMTIAAALAMIWTLAFAIRAFYVQDEFLKQRVLISWYLGGLTGLAVSFPIYLFVMVGGLDQFLEPGTQFGLRGLKLALAGGYSLLMIAQFAGFLATVLYRKATGR